MLAYKGFTKELTATKGKGVFEFEVGPTYTEEECKTVRNGFHCCENPFECLTYYPLNGSNRYFLVNAAGNIDEDEGERIACTKLTLLKELTLKEFAGHGMTYMVQHPMRDKWEKDHYGIKVAKEKAEATEKNNIAIARGKNPRVRGVEGAILGLLLEPVKGEIASAKLFVPNKQQAGKWYTIDRERNLWEVRDEKESD